MGSSTPSNNNSSSIVDSSRTRIREATAKLRAEGVDDAEVSIRLGAAVMVERVLAKYDQRRGTVGPAWLRAAVRKGDAYPELTPVPQRETASELLQALEEARAS